MYYDLKRSGEIIKTLRREKGLTQEAFADELNIDRSAVGKIENGTRGCSVDLLLCLSEILDVSVHYLLRGHDFVSKKEKSILKNELQEAIDLLKEVERNL